MPRCSLVNSDLHCYFLFFVGFHLIFILSFSFNWFFNLIKIGLEAECSTHCSTQPLPRILFCFFFLFHSLSFFLVHSFFICIHPMGVFVCSPHHLLSSFSLAQPWLWSGLSPSTFSVSCSTMQISWQCIFFLSRFFFFPFFLFFLVCVSCVLSLFIFLCGIAVCLYIFLSFSLHSRILMN